MSAVRLGRQGVSVPSTRLSDALAHTSSGLLLESIAGVHQISEGSSGGSPIYVSYG